MVAGTTSLVKGGDKYSVKKIIVHENYGTKNDISLLYLTKEIMFNDVVKPIELPEKDTEGGADVILTGWGTTSVRILYDDI